MLDNNSLNRNDSIASNVGSFIWTVIKGLVLLAMSFILPPLAVALKGTFKQFITCLILTILGWIPGVIYAIFTIEIDFKR